MSPTEAPLPSAAAVRALPQPAGHHALASVAGPPTFWLHHGLTSILVVWEVATGAQVTPPLTVRYAQDMKFDDTARRLLVASVDKSIRVIDLSPDTRPVAELAERATLLANRTPAADGGLVPLPPAEAERLWDKYRPRPADKPYPVTPGFR